MYKDTAFLWKPFIVLFGIRAVYLFLLMTNPFFIAIAIFYFVSIYSLRSNGKRFPMIFPVIIADIAMLVALDILNGFLGIIVVILPLVLLLILSFIIYFQMKKEVMLFERTLLSFNMDDLVLARKAMKTMDPADIAKVAEYRSWDTIK
ncbi:MAG: hypothetical protein INQ03_23635 [Candidatus Heimdallarchaeota archaeon]|nr:hypothetical protein [Candidatus Heimdallarchaeota archaeon]